MASSRARVQSGPLKNSYSSARRTKPAQPRQPATTTSRQHSSLSSPMASLSISDTSVTEKRGDSTVREVQGDLFSCPNTASLAHCVSADLRMGRGIAKVFKAKFNGIDDLKAQRKKTGDVAVLERDRRFIYYLVTKDRYFHKPTLDTLCSSLEKMRDHCKANDVKQLCMPMIGCGLDLLTWDSVKPMIIEVFSGLDISITVYYL